MVAIGVCDLCRGIKLGEYRENETKLTSNGIIMILLGSIIVTYRGSAELIDIESAVDFAIRIQVEAERE